MGRAQVAGGEQRCTCAGERQLAAGACLLLLCKMALLGPASPAACCALLVCSSSLTYTRCEARTTMSSLSRWNLALSAWARHAVLVPASPACLPLPSTVPRAAQGHPGRALLCSAAVQVTGGARLGTEGGGRVQASCAMQAVHSQWLAVVLAVCAVAEPLHMIQVCRLLR